MRNFDTEKEEEEEEKEEKRRGGERKRTYVCYDWSLPRIFQRIVSTDMP
jgi:hypothetical protein